MSLLIKGGTIHRQGKSEKANLLIKNKKIVGIGQFDTADEVIDATGYTLLPGFIDAHTHLDMDTGVAHTADDFESGTRAAIKGGTTTIVDFATQSKGETLQVALRNWHQKTSKKCFTNYGFHMAITQWNEEVAKELPKMIEEGVTSFKLYMAYDALRVNDGEIYEILKKVNSLGGIVSVHCENGDLVNQLIKEQLACGNTSPLGHPMSRPAWVEKEAISRFLDIAYLAKTPVHIVHLSTGAGLEEVERARKRGQQVYVETCPQYLVLDESYYEMSGFEGAKYVLAPPLRNTRDVERVWKGVCEGQIDTISTDHCSFNFGTQKKIGENDFSKIPCGIPGIEHRAQLIYTYGVTNKKITIQRMSELLSTNIAKLFGMYPKKGILEVGSDADIVVWNPNYEETIEATRQLQNVDYTPYEGIRVKGRAEHVVLGGTQVVKNGMIISLGEGEYIKRKADNLL